MKALTWVKPASLYFIWLMKALPRGQCGLLSSELPRHLSHLHHQDSFYLS